MPASPGIRRHPTQDEAVANGDRFVLLGSSSTLVRATRHRGGKVQRRVHVCRLAAFVALEVQIVAPTADQFHHLLLPLRHRPLRSRWGISRRRLCPSQEGDAVCLSPTGRASFGQFSLNVIWSVGGRFRRCPAGECAHAGTTWRSRGDWLPGSLAVRICRRRYDPGNQRRGLVGVPSGLARERLACRAGFSGCGRRRLCRC